MNAQDLKERTKQFALRVMRLVDALPNTPKGRAIASQLVRSGTSVAANYRAACRGRSKAEFIAKVGIAEEEADETALWLELIINRDGSCANCHGLETSPTSAGRVYLHVALPGGGDDSTSGDGGP